MATILLADDSAELRSTYAEALKFRGHVVLEAQDGLEAIEIARSAQPDLLLLDVWMPNCDGLGVLEALRFDPVATRMRVAMLSVLGNADVQLSAFADGANAYLVKGMALADFLAAVERLLAPIDALATTQAPAVAD